MKIQLHTNLPITSIGIIIFVSLYIIATLFYPGGSSFDAQATGFSWAHNFWCNLLNEVAINGQSNQARPLALTAMITLCFSLSFFWIIFPIQTNAGKMNRRIIQIAGILSMMTAFFLFSKMNHDLVTNFASFFGLITTLGVLFALYKIKWHRLFFWGIVNLLLVLLNNYIYYQEALIVYLPIVQKISFAAFLVWIISIDLQLIRSQLKN